MEAVVQLSPVFAKAVYPVTAEPPSDEGAVQETTDFFDSLLVAVTETGESGLPFVVAETEFEDEPLPIALVAAIVKLYDVASNKLDIVHEVVAVVQVAPEFAVTV